MEGLPVQANCNQYCLKWNNHKLNISGVFERLRSEQHFCDLTLTSADQRFLRCHRLLLCAGSGFLEEVLTLNPSDHPTVILSQINYDEMKLLVDFMYSGEVSVETGKLGKLLEAAKILKIKGLWESGLDGREDGEDGASSVDDAPTTTQREEGQQQTTKAERSDAETKEEEDELASSAQVTGRQKRKRKSLPPSLIETKLVKTDHAEEEESPKHSGILTPTSNASNPEVYSPMFGVSNAYFLTSQDQKSSNETGLNNGGKAIGNNGESTNVSPTKTKMLSDIPKLLAQTPIHPALITAMSPNTTTLPPFLPSLFDASNANLPSKQSDVETPSSAKPKKSKNVKPSDKPFVDANNRKYKQYTEETLQLALKEIMDGQSINRSSMRYNIPARTLRDWMKRLNIKSVFTHNQMASPPGGSRNPSTESDCSSVTNSTNSIVKSSTPSAGTVPAGRHRNSPDFGDGETSEDEEEEIDDDEENNQAS